MSIHTSRTAALSAKPGVIYLVEHKTPNISPEKLASTSAGWSLKSVAPQSKPRKVTVAQRKHTQEKPKQTPKLRIILKGIIKEHKKKHVVIKKKQK